MALINLYTDFDKTIKAGINHNGSVIDWVLKNIKKGQNFKVYDDTISGDNEISRSPEKMAKAEKVTIVIMPAGGVVSIIASIIIGAVLTKLLAPEIPNIDTETGRESPNNNLTDRRNKSRPNARIPDICGQVKSIPDIIAVEYSRYIDNTEERIGYYCVGRGRVSVEELKDGDTLLSAIDGASAGIYYPLNSPNISDPEEQIGQPINERVYGVYKSSEAIGQTILAPNEENYKVLGAFSNTSVKCDRVTVNVYAPSGIYYQDNNARTNKTINYRVSVQILDDNGNAIGNKIIINESITGNNSNEKGKTTEFNLGGLFYFSVYVERTSNADFSGRSRDEIKLKDIYGFYDIGNIYFGNTTTIQTKRIANAQNASIRNPELNCIATEMTYKYLGSGVFDSQLSKNTQAMQSLIRLALDPKIGRRQQSEIDLDGLIQNQSLIEEYFNSPDAGQFSYTFDNMNDSAENIFYTIATAAFCLVWREGRVLKSYFDRPQSMPSMVFTHRSKAPDSETWTRETSQGKRKDSIELVYIDDKTYKKETLYYPADRSGLNPKRVEAKGVKGKAQATWRLMREYNRLVYNKESVDFTSTIEGSLVKPMELISVVKGTRIGSYDGEVWSINGLDIELSQSVQFTPNDDHFIVLKRRNGTIESIPVTATQNDRIVKLEYLPVEPIYTGNSELKTQFSFGNESRLNAQLVLPLEIDASDGQYARIKAINYTHNYYKDDPVQPLAGDFNDDFNNDFWN